MKVRPYARELIKHCSEKWNLIVFTASTRDYAEIILERLDPKNQYIRNVLSRENCVLMGFRFIKDFRIIANEIVHVKDMLMLDNKVISFGFNLSNGIPILPFLGDESDSELKAILPILDMLSDRAVSIGKYIQTRYNYKDLVQANIT